MGLLGVLLSQVAFGVVILRYRKFEYSKVSGYSGVLFDVKNDCHEYQGTGHCLAMLHRK